MLQSGAECRGLLLPERFLLFCRMDVSMSLKRACKSIKNGALLRPERPLSTTLQAARFQRAEHVGGLEVPCPTRSAGSGLGFGWQGLMPLTPQTSGLLGAGPPLAQHPILGLEGSCGGS